jgi:D-alanyl-D-alanine endopeptidase (penicillin-binding protein 7)
MRRPTLLITGALLGLLTLAAWPSATQARTQSELWLIYDTRPDLQAVFEPVTGEVRDSVRARHPDMTNLQEWARLWGYQEYPVRLSDYGPPVDIARYRQALARIYWERTDLQAIFDANTWRIKDSARDKHGDLANLEEWARNWGYQEYPGALFPNMPANAILADSRASSGNAPVPPIVIETEEESDIILIDNSPDPFYDTEGALPRLQAGAKFPFDKISANSVLVIDDETHDVLLARNSKTVWPIASITKLMNAMVVLDRKVSFDKVMRIESSDVVGGVRLRVPDRSRLTVRDLFYATLVSSANDAAMTLSRSTGMSQDEFVRAMNAKAAAIGLKNTQFADPTGLELGNVSTARDVAKLLTYALDNYYWIRAATTTDEYSFTTVDGYKHEIDTTNKLLADENNGLYVLGGKTGYLIESQWNLVFRVKDSRGKPVTAVILGADYKSWVFAEADRAVRWVWDNYDWP